MRSGRRDRRPPAREPRSLPGLVAPLALLALLAHLTLAGGPSVAEDAPRRTDRAVLERKAPAVEAFLREQVRRSGFTSLVFGLFTGEGLVFSRGVGPRELGGNEEVTAESVYEMASITKLLPGIALLQLRDAGKLSLDDPVAKHLPEVGRVPMPEGWGPITLAQLLSHTSGLPREWPIEVRRTAAAPITEAELLESLPRVALAARPGTESIYSNVGAAVAGLVAARVSGEGSFAAYATRHILAPLGMSSSVWSPRDVPPARLAQGTRLVAGMPRPAANLDNGAASAQGGLFSSVADMARLGAFELRGWRDEGPDEPVLRRSSVRESQRSAPEEVKGKFRASAFFELHDDPELGACPSKGGEHPGYRSALVLAPARGVGAIVLVSGDPPSKQLREVVAREALLIALEGGDATRRESGRRGDR